SWRAFRGCRSCRRRTRSPTTTSPWPPCARGRPRRWSWRPRTSPRDAPTRSTMAAALFALRRMSGVRRPALAVQIPVPGRDGPPLVLLDAGANADVRSQDLVQFAYLGAAFAAAVLGVPRPRVALLSVGEEARKGSAAVVAAHEEIAALAG